MSYIKHEDLFDVAAIYALHYYCRETVGGDRVLQTMNEILANGNKVMDKVDCLEILQEMYPDFIHNFTHDMVHF